MKKYLSLSLIIVFFTDDVFYPVCFVVAYEKIVKKSVLEKKVEKFSTFESFTKAFLKKRSK